jgi:CubicO group peptidase (beta-lactamase class C family)
VETNRDAEAGNRWKEWQENLFGTKWEYSNLATWSRIIVAKVSEYPSANSCTRIRAAQNDFIVSKGKSEVVGRAYGHSKKENGLVETDQSPTSATQGDGGIYSNLEDLSKWDDALRDHTLLDEKDFLPAITPAQLPPGAEAKLAEDVPDSLRGHATAYGFGWFLNLQDSHPLMWHYKHMGFKSAILRRTPRQRKCNQFAIAPI